MEKWYILSIACEKTVVCVQSRNQSDFIRDFPTFNLRAYKAKRRKRWLRSSLAESFATQRLVGSLNLTSVARCGRT
ncbi:hypothetical protein HOLleu_15908 [Holothuria leucospilota]|uniref:Uncharacterized protein n=1 Tax=Holothuria leucospilota TaxID=206669 RepID=A0A9Q1H7F8_HOLLE|nr:hypothetical protein HOLleu_15908 [Holothuria leucospilota]